MSLFKLGEEIFKNFGLSVESEITFSDYCKADIYSYKDRIKFTSKALLFFHPIYGTGEHASDDWIDCESDLTPFYRPLWMRVFSVFSMNSLGLRLSRELCGLTSL